MCAARFAVARKRAEGGGEEGGRVYEMSGIGRLICNLAKAAFIIIDIVWMLYVCVYCRRQSTQAEHVANI